MRGRWRPGASVARFRWCGWQGSAAWRPSWPFARSSRAGSAVGLGGPRRRPLVRGRGRAAGVTRVHDSAAGWARSNNLRPAFGGWPHPYTRVSHCPIISVSSACQSHPLLALALASRLSLLPRVVARTCQPIAALHDRRYTYVRVQLDPPTSQTRFRYTRSWNARIWMRRCFGWLHPPSYSHPFRMNLVLIQWICHCVVLDIFVLRLLCLFFVTRHSITLLDCLPRRHAGCSRARTQCAAGGRPSRMRCCRTATTRWRPALHKPAEGGSSQAGRRRRGRVTRAPSHAQSGSRGWDACVALTALSRDPFSKIARRDLQCACASPTVGWRQGGSHRSMSSSSRLVEVALGWNSPAPAGGIRLGSGMGKEPRSNLWHRPDPAEMNARRSPLPCPRSPYPSICSLMSTQCAYLVVSARTCTHMPASGCTAARQN